MRMPSHQQTALSISVQCIPITSTDSSVHLSLVYSHHINRRLCPYQSSVFPSHQQMALSISVQCIPITSTDRLCPSQSSVFPSYQQMALSISVQCIPITSTDGSVHLSPVYSHSGLLYILKNNAGCRSTNMKNIT